MIDDRSALATLAEDLGIELAYVDIRGRERPASPESLLATIRALGVEIGSASEAATVLEERRYASATRMLEPVIVVWQGDALVVDVRLQESTADVLECRLTMEAPGEGSASQTETTCLRLRDLPTVGERRAGSATTVDKRITWPSPLAPGYYRLELAIASTVAESWVVCAPRRVPVVDERARLWGVFAPTYALRSQHNWGIGNYADLERLATWAGERGASFVGTLPLLSAFLGEPFHPSPYAAASRLFYNEVFVDIDSIPELSVCEQARRERQAPELGERILALRATDLVDYREQMVLKRRILEALSREIPDSAPQRFEEFRRYQANHPRLADYARFRAVGDRLEAAWQAWPAALKGGTISDGDFDPMVARYYEYAQWIADEQVRRVVRAARARGARLYLDLPLGAQASSYDVFRGRHYFVLDASAGAPPDDLFTGGQSWGNPPLHPERIRQERYEYLIASLRHHFEHAGLLRLDHVMGLHRIFCVPAGAKPEMGVYVRYRSDELYAVLSVEAHRCGTAIVGEDLGTVPEQVRISMAEHGLYRMHVAQFEMTDDRQQPLRPVARHALASLNTHDTMPFSGFAAMRDVDEKVNLGLATEDEVAEERAFRERVLERLRNYLREQQWLGNETGLESLSSALYYWLAASPAQLLSINLEDLWDEEAPQNVPGTSSERPNWQRKHQLSLEAILEREDFRRMLERIHQLRQQEA